MPEQHWNPNTTLDRLEHDQVLLNALIVVFLEDVGELLRTIRLCVHRNDTREAGRGAHSLRGMALNFDAFVAAASAEALEAVCATGCCRGARLKLPRLYREFDSLQRELRDWTASYGKNRVER